MASGSGRLAYDPRTGPPLSRGMTPETHIGKISACEMGGGVGLSRRPTHPHPASAPHATMPPSRPATPARHPPGDRHGHVRRPAPSPRTQVLGPPPQPRITRVNTVRCSRPSTDIQKAPATQPGDRGFPARSLSRPTPAPHPATAPSDHGAAQPHATGTRAPSPHRSPRAADP